MRDWLVYLRFNVSQERSRRARPAHGTQRRTDRASPRRRGPPKCTLGHSVLRGPGLHRSFFSRQAVVDCCAWRKLYSCGNVGVFSVQSSVCDQDAMPILLDRARGQLFASRAREPVSRMVNI